VTPVYDGGGVRLFCGDSRDVLASLPAESVQTCVTSPPYWGLRDYGVAGQLGLEATPEAYVASLVAVFAEVRRVLCDDGTLWLNLGDSYATQPGKGNNVPQTKWTANTYPESAAHRSRGFDGLKPKDLVGIPWRVAFALQADGWYLRSDVIWHKPNPMPESVTDRPTKAHEYLFLLSKSERYVYDADAIAEPFAEASIERLRQNIAAQRGSDRVPGKTNGPMKAVGLNANRSSYKPGSASSMNDGVHVAKSDAGLPLRESGRNKRTVWTVPTEAYKGAHFAVFPPDLIKPCVLAGSRPGDVVLDPFAGSGTTLYVAKEFGRQALGVELNPAYCDLAARRLRQDVLFSAATAAPEGSAP